MSPLLARIEHILRRVPKGIAYGFAIFGKRLKEKPLDDINAYERRFYSQNGEDGILEEIFARIAPARRYFVEFGVQDGLQCNAANLAFRHGWSGLMIEGDALSAARVRKHYSGRPVRVVEAFIDRDNIDELFRANSVPHDLEMLSIDIDGNDYWVWEALKSFAAALVVIEFNAIYPPPFRWTMTYNAAHIWNGTTYHGASLSSLTDLARRLGYSLLGTDRHGVNAFFLRDDLVARAGFRVKTPEQAFNFQKGFPKLPYGYGPFVEI